MNPRKTALVTPALVVIAVASYAAAACSSASTASAPVAPAEDAATTDDGSTADSGAQDARTSADDAGDVPECDPAHPGDCASNEYCALANCEPGTGVCTPRPAESAADLRFDTCGCDGIEYWNETIAGSRGASLRAGCNVDKLKRCGGPTNAKCPAGTYCQYSGSCDGTISPEGICWAVPTTCDTITGSWSECGAEAGAPATCTNLCVVTKNEKPFGGAPLGTCK